jgi:hypothetical protein
LDSVKDKTNLFEFSSQRLPFGDPLRRTLQLLITKRSGKRLKQLVMMAYLRYSDQGWTAVLNKVQGSIERFLYP